VFIMTGVEVPKAIKTINPENENCLVCANVNSLFLCCSKNVLL